jgi:hypothetical protein
MNVRNISGLKNSPRWVPRSSAVAQNVDLPPGRREHAVEESQVEIGKAVDQPVGHLGLDGHVDQQIVDAAQERGVLKDAGAAGHHGEVFPFGQPGRELGEVEPVGVGPAMLLVIVDRRGSGQNEFDKAILGTGGRLHDLLTPAPEVLPDAVAQRAARRHRSAVRGSTTPRRSTMSLRSRVSNSRCVRVPSVAVQTFQHPRVGVEVHRHPVRLRQMDGGQHPFLRAVGLLCAHGFLPAGGCTRGFAAGSIGSG